MILLLSPSKTLGDGTAPCPITPTQPQWLKESAALIKEARTLSPADLQKLMDISAKLAELNHARFAQFQTPFTSANATPALFTFQGDVYDGLDAHSLKAKDIAFAQDHLRILSGLYGLLRPLDLMQPYRLEMGIALTNPRGKNLYQFWGERITGSINEAAKEAKAKAVINLASEEYFKAVKPALLAAPLIEVQFKERKGGKLATIGLMAKRARGRMAGWVIRQRILKPADLAHFNEDGYAFQPSLSDAGRLVFVR